jgi:hypothetical protein
MTGGGERHLVRVGHGQAAVVRHAEEKPWHEARLRLGDVVTDRASRRRPSECALVEPVAHTREVERVTTGEHNGGPV